MKDIAELEDELDEEEKVCKSFKRKVKELELSIAKEEQRNGEAGDSLLGGCFRCRHQSLRGEANSSAGRAELHSAEVRAGRV